ncbi:MAG: ABC transporter substrate-binding protein [bacterium]|nr:ABC transporter substrate-binding protein [bacterium]
MKYYYRIFIAITSIGIAIFLGCSFIQNKPKLKTVVIGGVLGDKINPILVAESTLTAIETNIFDGLIQMNDQLELIPHLAQRWQYSPDRKELTIHLRAGVKFHDGVELTADDVKFTYDAIMHPKIASYLASEFNSVDHIEVLGRYQLRIVFKEPNTNFLYTMRIAILPKHRLTITDLQNPNLAFNRHPIGTGPFKVEQWIDETLILTANPDYFLGKPNLDRIIVRSLPNQTVTWSQLMTEQIDVAEGVLPEDYKVLLTNPKIQGYKTPARYYYMVILNNRSPLFADVRIRKALNYAVDKQAMIDEVLLGEGSIARSIFPPDSSLYNRTTPSFQYQPRTALKLLNDAGWSIDKKTRQLKKQGVPFEFTLLIDEDNTLKRQLALILDQQLQELGINLYLKSLPVSQLINEYLLPKKFDAAIAEMDSLYETNFGYAFFHSDQIQNGLNAFSYTNNALDKIYDQLQVTVDPDLRKDLIDQIQYELAVNPPGILLFFPYKLSGANTRIAYIHPRSSDNIYWNLKDWDIKL